MNIEGVYSAIRRDLLDKLKPLITRVNVNTAVFYTLTPIELAARQNATQCFYWLFDTMNASIGQTLFITVRHDQLKLTKHLLCNGVDPHSVDKDGCGVIAYAINNAEMIELLLSYGVDVNAKSRFRQLDNVLHRKGGGDKKIAELLIEAGAHTADIDKEKVEEIKQNIATKKKHCRSAIIALFFTLKSYGIPRDVIRLMAKRIRWLNM